MLKRNKKLASRLLAALMALACVLTLLPGAAMAAGEDDGEGKEEKLYLSMVRKKDGKPLPFANEGAGSRLLIGRWMVQGGLHGREKGNTD